MKSNICKVKTTHPAGSRRKMQSSFFKKFNIKAFSFLLFFYGFNLFSSDIDSIYRFTEQAAPEIVEYEKERIICILDFENKSNNNYLNYLQHGLASVIFSNLNDFKLVYDPEVLPIRIYHSYGEPKNIDMSKYKKINNSQTIKELNSGKVEAIPEKDPRYIKAKTILLKTNQTEELNYFEGIARKKNCYYVIKGRVEQTGEDSLKINAEVWNRRNQKAKSFSINTSLKRAYQEISPITTEIKSYLLNKEATFISVLTGKENDAMVFIDGEYIGKTPIENRSVPVGKHKLAIQKNDFVIEERIVDFKEKSTSTYNIELVPIEKKGIISVYTEPAGADAYLGNTYLGKTPIENFSVPVGLNRVKITMESKISFYKGVDIKEGKPVEVNTKLKEGDSLEYHKNVLNVYQDYSYFDFASYSLTGLLASYAGYMYGITMISKTRDQLRSEVSDLFTFINFSNNNRELATLQYMWDTHKVSENEKRVGYYRNIRNNSAISGGVMLTLGLGFFWLGIENEGLNFAFQKNITPVGVDSLSVIQYVYRF